MTDIVERLRADGALAGHYDVPAVQREAADEIERLRAEVARCEASLLAWVEAVGECNKDRTRLRAECQRLAGEVSRAHRDALAWMERAAVARREGIEAELAAAASRALLEASHD